MATPDKVGMGGSIRDIRWRQGLTQKELASMAGISDSALRG